MKKHYNYKKWLFWGAISITVLAVTIICRTNEVVIRLTGLFLQLLGISTVIWGISETRALFGLPSFAASIKSWLGRFKLFRRDAVFCSCEGTLPSIGGGSRARPVHSAGSNLTIEARLDAIERNLTAINERMTQAENEMDKKFQKITEVIIKESHTREAEDAAIRAKLVLAETGGFHITAIGVSCLFFGVILSTVSAEIVIFFQ